MIDKKKSCTGKLTTKKLQRDLNPKKKRGKKTPLKEEKAFWFSVWALVFLHHHHLRLNFVVFFSKTQKTNTKNKNKNGIPKKEAQMIDLRRSWSEGTE
jgi:hypothetical protein